MCSFCTCLFPILQLKSPLIKNSEINYSSLRILISSFKTLIKFTFKLYNLLVGNNKEPIQFITVPVLFPIKIHIIFLSMSKFRKFLISDISNITYQHSCISPYFLSYMYHCYIIRVPNSTFF